MAIIRLFETPTNEGTRAWIVGRGYGYQKARIVDHRFETTYTWTAAAIELDLSGDFYRVIDQEGRVRIKLPIHACGIECGYDGDLGPDSD